MSSSSIESEFLMLNSLLHTKLVKGLDCQLNIHGISFTEFMIMHHLNCEPNKTLRRIDLADRVGISASGVTRLLAPLEKNRIVEKEKNPRDARVSLVKLSKVGEKLYEESAVSFEYCAKSLVNRLSVSQLQKLIEYSRKLL